MSQEIITLFKDAGLHDKEARVYVALLEQGEANVSQIAEASRLKRPIIYVTLDALMKKGLATKQPSKKVGTYRASDPRMLAAQVNSTAKNFIEMLPYLQNLGKKNEQRPKIHFFDTEEAIWAAYKEMCYQENIVVITSYARMARFFPQSTEQWLKSCEKGIYRLKNARHILTETPEDIAIGKRLAKIGQKVKYIKQPNAYAVDFVLYHDKLALTLIDERSFITVIESAPLVDSMRGLFEIVWKTGKWVK